MARTSSISEKPISDRPRRLADWLNPTGAKKVHSLVDKVYKRKNLELAWKRVRRNQGMGGVDGESIEEFEENLEKNLDRLGEELCTDTYEPQPVLRRLIPKAGQPGKHRQLGIPTIYDRVCQQALHNRLEPIFEPVFDDANFGYRRERSTKDALRKVWKEIEAGREWIVDADLRDFFGSADHAKVIALVHQRVSDGRVLRLIEAFLKAGCIADGTRLPTEQGVPQGGVVSPILSNILLTPFDREMRRKGFSITRYADDWVATCETKDEARAILSTASKIRSGTRRGMLYAYPRDKSTQHFRDQIRSRTRRKAPVSTCELIQQINPVIRGWGNYYCKAHIRKLFARLDRWIIRRLWSHRYKRWRCRGYRTLPERKLYQELGLVRLITLIPSLALR